MVQLSAYVGFPRRVSLTAAQLHQVTQVLAERGDADAAKRADAALTQALAAMKGKG